MNSPPLIEWNNIISLSAQMLDKAQAEEWETVQQLSVERQAKLEAFFSTEVSLDDAQTIAAGIEQIQSIDKELTAIAGKEHKQVASNLSDLSKNRQAVSAYEQHR
jgi:hypothetical protein